MSIIDGFMQMRVEENRLEKLRQKLKPADLRGEKKCVMCGFCCHRRTCIPTPEELKKIAEFLNLTPKKLINKFFAIDRQWLGKDYYVKPLSENILDLAGKFIPNDRTFNEGKCVFLDENNKCKIYPVRPKTAQIQKCWEEDEEDKENVIDSWKDNVLEKEFGIKVNEYEEENE